MDPSSPAPPGLADVEREVLGGALVQNAELVAAGLQPGPARDVPPALPGLAAARSMALLLEDIVRVLVRQARAEGHTWAAIGDVLHVTRQAAFQRFGGQDDGAEMAADALAEPLPDAAERAEAVIDDFAAGRLEEMRARFDDRMRAACSAELLDTVRAKLAREAGDLLRIRGPAVAVRSRYTVADVPLVLERGECTCRVTLSETGQVAGFFVRPVGRQS